MIKIIIFLITIIEQTKLISCQIFTSPFNMNSIYSPSGISRISHQLLIGQTRAFTIPLINTFNDTPIILYSITSLEVNRGINYNISLSSITQTSISGIITADSTVVKAKLLFLSLDANYFYVVFSNFQYRISEDFDSNTDQQIIIPNHQTYDASFLVGMQVMIGPSPSGYSPFVNSVVLESSSTLIPTTLSIKFNPSQITINYLCMYFIKINTSFFKTPPFSGSAGQKLMIYGTNGYSTDIMMIPINLQTYKNNYFVGLQAIYDNQFIFNDLSFNILTVQNYRMNYYVSQLIFAGYFCPLKFPYMNINRTICYNQCQIGWYGNDQYICSLCDTNCKTCIKYANNCVGCHLPFSLVYGNKCGCKNGTFLQVSEINGSIICANCNLYITGCYTCTNRNTCTKCKNNLILTNPQTCSCPSSTRQLMVNGSKYCISEPINTVYIQTCNYNLSISSHHCICDKSLNLTFSNKWCT